VGGIRVERRGPVAGVTLDRPTVRNALSTQLLMDLRAAFEDLAADRDVRAVVLAGADPDFCAGADVAELEAGRETGGIAAFDEVFRTALEAIARHPVPVVARIQGRALGGGCQLVLACDLAVAAEDARLGIPSARLGIVIPLDSMERLVLAVGPRRAAELLLAGRVLHGHEAEAWGLVARSVPPGTLDLEVEELVADLVEAAPLSVRASKLGIGLAVDRTVGRVAAEAEAEELAGAVFASEDLAEGLRALRERRRPTFRGR
jgi:enoyl-CoA hydratase/carnithine racemase